MNKITTNICMKFIVKCLKQIDAEHIQKADKKVQEQNRRQRVRTRLLKRKRKEYESESYCPGRV